MKLKTLEELQRVAEVRPPLTRDRMSKRQLLERWAEVLELAPQRYLHVTDIGCRSCGWWRCGFAGVRSRICNALRHGFWMPKLRVVALGICRGSGGFGL